jgi:cell division topological specificity factor
VKLLNKILWFGSLSSTKLSSKSVAKERLKLALTYDRGGLARGTIEQLRDEIIQLIAKHLAIREEDIQINFDRTPECDKLIATIPLQTAQRPQAQKATSTPAKKAPPRRRRRRSRPPKRPDPASP